MKKFLLSGLTMLICGSAYALPIGNPTEASFYTHGLCWNQSSAPCNPCNSCISWCDVFSVRLGFYGDYVFNRHMQIKSGGTEGSDINDTELFTNAGIVVLNIFDWFDIFGTFGVTNISMVADASTFSTNTSAPNYFHFTSTWSWSVGGRATLWECRNFGIGLEGQYFSTRPDLDNIFSSTNIVSFNTNNDTQYSEWQVGLGASYTFTTGCPGIAFIPYMGAKWAQSEFALNDFSFTDGAPYVMKDLQSKKNWGYAVGITATVNEIVGVTVEGRFADEKAFYTTMQVRF